VGNFFLSEGDKTEYLERSNDRSPLPFKPNGITYSETGKAFYAQRLSDNMKMEKQSIARLAVQ
jgi:hypothetical protein